MTQALLRDMEPADVDPAAELILRHDWGVRRGWLAEPADLAPILSLDRAATGEDRAHALRRFVEPATAKVVSDADGAVRGFVVRAPWGGGATIAPDVEDAVRLLRARQVAAGPAGRVRVGILESNRAGLERLESEGLRRIWSAPRLARGAPLEWRPHWIWGQLNPAMG